MSQSATLNGSSYTIPDVGENDWGQNVTDFLVAIPGAVLQKSGGAFTLTAEVDFGATYGLKSAYYKSRAANPATAGAVRLGVADVVSFRNNANGANLDVGIDAADALTFGGNKIVTVAGGFTWVGTNSYANQKGIRFMEQTGNGTNYIEVVAPDAVTANVTLKLPDGAGSSGQVLSTDGAGVLSWINAAGGGTVNSGVAGRLALYPANGTTVDDVATLTSTVSIVVASQGQASVYTIPDAGAATADFVMTAGTQSIAGAKTFSGATVHSSTVSVSVSNAAAFTVSTNNAFKVDSTNALVSIGTSTMAYPLYVSKSSAGANVTIAVENTESANGASHARVYVVTGGASGGDPFITLYNGVQNYSIGLDNSDSDALCITGAATLNGTNLWRMTSAGAVTQAAGLTVTTGGITVSAGAVSLPAGNQTTVSLNFGTAGTGFYGSSTNGVRFSSSTTAVAFLDENGINLNSGKFQLGGNQTYEIMQVQFGTSTGSATSTTSTSFVDTNCTVTITPKFNTSKIIIIACGVLRTANDATNAAIATLARGSTNLSASSNGLGYYISGYAGAAVGYTACMIYYDSPATTSATTYKVRIRSDIGSAATTWDTYAQSNIIAIEVAQ